MPVNSTMRVEEYYKVSCGANHVSGRLTEPGVAISRALTLGVIRLSLSASR